MESTLAVVRRCRVQIKTHKQVFRSIKDMEFVNIFPDLVLQGESARSPIPAGLMIAGNALESSSPYSLSRYCQRAGACEKVTLASLNPSTRFRLWCVGTWLNRVSIAWFVSSVAKQSRDNMLFMLTWKDEFVHWSEYEEAVQKATPVDSETIDFCERFWRRLVEPGAYRDKFPGVWGDEEIADSLSSQIKKGMDFLCMRDGRLSVLDETLLTQIRDNPDCTLISLVASILDDVGNVAGDAFLFNRIQTLVESGIIGTKGSGFKARLVLNSVGESTISSESASLGKYIPPVVVGNTAME
ncbi:MAG: DUF3658 domain-containing protein [Planctomycetota bacterium]